MYSSKKKVSYARLNLLEEIHRASKRVDYNPPVLESVKINSIPKRDVLEYFKYGSDCIVFINLPGSLALKELKALRELRELILLNNSDIAWLFVRSITVIHSISGVVKSNFLVSLFVLTL